MPNPPKKPVKEPIKSAKLRLLKSDKTDTREPKLKLLTKQGVKLRTLSPGSAEKKPTPPTTKNFTDKKGKQTKTNKKGRVYALVIFVVGIILFLIMSGYISRSINIYPLAKLDKKTQTLACDYAGRKMSVSVDLYGNINNYYHNNNLKNKASTSGRYSDFVYSNSSDRTIKELAQEIKNVGKINNLNDDQILELTTCMIQNIPYDTAKAGIVLGTGNISNYDKEQYPYETLFKNSGICTDKTYLGSALLRELGYSTGILMFPDDQHMALGIKVPDGYTAFSSKYNMIELTSPGFAPGEIPEDIDSNNGKPSVSIKELADLTVTDNPSSVNYISNKTINAPTLIIDVSEGKSYQRIVAVKDLETKLIAGITQLESEKNNLDSQYIELKRREEAQASAYATYLATPSTKYECGYKYNYSYSPYLSYPYTYSYQSPYTYQCSYVTNSMKSISYGYYTGSYNSYTNQLGYYNQLVDKYNALLNNVRTNLNSYRQYDYN